MTAAAFIRSHNRVVHTATAAVLTFALYACVLLASAPIAVHSFCLQSTVSSKPLTHHAVLLSVSVAYTGDDSTGQILHQDSSSSQHAPTVILPTRRHFFLGSTGVATTVATVAALVSAPTVAHAGIDPLALKGLAVEGDQSGVQTRLRQIELEKIRPEDALDIPYTDLPSGVSYREFRQGKGDATVSNGSKVGVEMTVRCKAFATQKEPGGLMYYSTAEDEDFNELAWTIGSGQLLPQLEEGMMGMHKGAVRRIEVPTTAVYAARKANQLPLPKTSNKDGTRRFENLFKTDGTLLFEVLVTRIK